MTDKTIPELFFESAQVNAKSNAVLYKKEGVYFPLKYHELSEKIKDFAFILQDIFNIKHGDRVALLSENRPEWLICDIAIMTLGAIVVPIHTTLSSSAVFNVLEHSESKLLIVSNVDLLNRVLINRTELNFLEKIIVIDKLPAMQKANLEAKVFDWQNLFSQASRANFRKEKTSQQDPCTIIYTSGTTGEPKGVVLTHKNILNNVYNVNSIIPAQTSDIFLSFLPLSHALERTTGQFIPILHGATIAYAQNPKSLPKNLKEIKPTILISVPKIFERFHDAIWDKVNDGPKYKKKIFVWALKQKIGTLKFKIADALVFKKIRNNLGGRLRLTISGGAKLNDNLVKFFLKLGITILEGYGLTETSPVVAVLTQKDMNEFGKMGVGKALADTKIKISETKEILIKGDNVFLEYFKNKQATKEAFDQNGWFCSGDLGFIDKNNFLNIIGRKKEMIVLSGGKNVWPEPIENLLNNDRFISQSMVFGDGKNYISALICPDWQELEKYLKENNIPMSSHQVLVKDERIIKVFEQRIAEKINPELSDFEAVKKFVLLPEEFSQDNGELTPTLKLRRHIIMKHYKKETQILDVNR